MPSASSAKKEVPSKKKFRVMVAEDHVITRDAMADSIKDYMSDKVEVVAQAGDGIEAVELVKKHKPDLVVMDLQMPRMDGIQATREIRKHSPDTFVIVLSQIEDHPHIIKALDAGAREYLLKKDASMKALVSYIAAALEKKPGPYDSAIDRIQVARRYGIPLDRDQFLPPENEGVVTSYGVNLTNTEIEILKRAAHRGMAVKEIAQEMKSTPATVQKHLYHIYEKLGAENQAHAVCLAVKYRLIDPDLVESKYEEG